MRVEARGPVGAELGRLIERYNELRRAPESAGRVAVFSGATTAPVLAPDDDDEIEDDETKDERTGDQNA